jgi:hypothetical protein
MQIGERELGESRLIREYIGYLRKDFSSGSRSVRIINFT